LVLEQTTNGVILRVRLSPNSSCCKAGGVFKNPDGQVFWKISVISVPEKGKANSELITWLAKKIKISKSNFTIVSGELDRYKKILINGEYAYIKDKIDKIMLEG